MLIPLASESSPFSLWLLHKKQENKQKETPSCVPLLFLKETLYSALNYTLEGKRGETERKNKTGGLVHKCNQRICSMGHYE